MKKYIILLSAVVLFGACTKKNSHPDYFGTVVPNHPADEVWFNGSTEPQYLDPNKVADSASSDIVFNLFLRLTQTHPTKGTPIPELAKSWDISKDGLEYTFHIREDAKWSDGQPLTARDVEFSWKRLSDSATGSQYTQMMDAVENARPFREQAIQVTGLKGTDAKTVLAKTNKVAPVKDVAKSTDGTLYFVYLGSEDAKEKADSREKLITEINGGLLGKNITAATATSDIVQVKAKDDHTVYVKLERPLPYFLGMIEYVAFAIVPKHVIEKFKAEGKEDMWTRPENIVVSGPFTLVEESFKEYKIFKKNPQYFDAAKVKLNKVKVVQIEDYHASLNAYKTGQHEYGFGASLPTDMLDTVRAYKDYHHDPQLAVYYYEFNIKRPGLTDARVRRAMSLAIDRKKIVENVTREGQVPLRDVVPPGIAGFEGLNSEVFNLEEAKKLMADAGYPDGKGFPRLSLKFNTSSGHKQIAEAVQQMWKDNLGIQVDISNMEWRSMLEDQRLRNFDLMRMAWIGDYLDPHTFLSIFLSESGNNHTNWKNAEYDRLINDSDKTMDQKARFAAFVQAEKIMEQEAPITPIYGYTRSYMKKPFLRGFWPHFQDRHEWKYMWIDERFYKEVPTETNTVDVSWFD